MSSSRSIPKYRKESNNDNDDGDVVVDNDHRLCRLCRHRRHVVVVVVIVIIIIIIIMAMIGIRFQFKYELEFCVEGPIIKFLSFKSPCQGQRQMPH
jgi:hypothetical protein